MTLEARNAELEAENAALRAQVKALLARVQELEARAAKDRHTSGKPPASDGLKRRTKSLRKPSGKKPGGQLGHRGETLHLVATPDAVVEHRPAVCTACQAALDEAPVVRRERRQVHEVPAVRLRGREHQALHVRCPACQTVSVGAFPAAAPSRGPYGPQLRALAVYLEEQYHQAWATQLKALLLDMKAATEQARAEGRRQLPTAIRQAFVTRYRALLAAGHAANPPPERRPHQRGRVKQTPAQNLLERLWLGQEQVLAFLDDLTIPFDNNQAERDLRTLKMQQKVSGCFRSDPGADAFARLRSY